MSEIIPFNRSGWLISGPRATALAGSRLISGVAPLAMCPPGYNAEVHFTDFRLEAGQYSAIAGTPGVGQIVLGVPTYAEYKPEFHASGTITEAYLKFKEALRYRTTLLTNGSGFFTVTSSGTINGQLIFLSDQYLEVNNALFNGTVTQPNDTAFSTLRNKMKTPLELKPLEQLLLWVSSGSATARLMVWYNATGYLECYKIG